MTWPWLSASNVGNSANMPTSNGVNTSSSQLPVSSQLLLAQRAAAVAQRRRYFIS